MGPIVQSHNAIGSYICLQVTPSGHELTQPLKVSFEQQLFVSLDWIHQIQVSNMSFIFFWVVITMSRACTYVVIVE